MIVKNTTNTVVRITDLDLTINPNSSQDLAVPAFEIAASNELAEKIALGILIIELDGVELSISDALKVIYGRSIEPRDWTGKLFFHDTSRPFGTKVHFTGAGDSEEFVSDIGTGEDIEIEHVIGDPLIQITYSAWNTIANTTHIQEGQLQWVDAKRDKLTVEFVPRIITYSAGENTPYLFMPTSPIILPSVLAGGAGNVIINEDLSQANGGLVQSLPNEKGVKPPAYWTADFNSTTWTFENIQAAPEGNGDYNIFHMEYAIARFANRVGMLGSGILPFNTEDTDPLPHGARMRCTWETRGEDHNWSALASFKIHRERSC